METASLTLLSLISAILGTAREPFQDGEAAGMAFLVFVPFVIFLLLVAYPTLSAVPLVKRYADRVQVPVKRVMDKYWPEPPAPDPSKEFDESGVQLEEPYLGDKSLATTGDAAAMRPEASTSSQPSSPLPVEPPSPVWKQPGVAVASAEASSQEAAAI